MTESRVGLELEFMVAVRKIDRARLRKTGSSLDDRWPDSSATEFAAEDTIAANFACQKVVCRAMAKRGIPVGRIADRSPMSVDPDAEDIQDCVEINLGASNRFLVWNSSQEGINGSLIRFKNWFVSYEASVTSSVILGRMKTPGHYDWYAIEINSPILTDQEEFEQGLPTVKKTLDCIRNSAKVWINAECGFHVHISPLHKTLDISVARRIAALVLLLEHPLLLKLCHPSRQQSQYTRPISVNSAIAASASASSETRAASSPEANVLRVFRAGAKSRRSDEKRFFRMLCAIFSEPDLQSLDNGLRRPRILAGQSPEGARCGTAISNYPTVEMRYPEASFDVDFLSLWVDLGRRILAMATAPDGEYNKKLLELYDMATANMELGWIHWLKAVGLEERADFCKNRISRYGSDLKDLDKNIILPKVGSGEPAK